LLREGQVARHEGRLGLVLGLVSSLENVERKIKNHPHISTHLSHLNVTNHGAKLAFAQCTLSPRNAFLIAHMCPVM